MRIIVATDGSRGSTAALRFAARLAGRDHRSQLIVLTIGAIAGGSRAPASAWVRCSVPTAKEQRQLSRKILEEAAKELRNCPLRAQFRFVRTRRGPIPEAISREADRLKADLVVVGSEGRDTLSEWVLGGVALRLIYLARRPVAVVRPPPRRKAS